MVAKVKTEMFLLITSKKTNKQTKKNKGDEKDTKSRTFGDLGGMILHLKSSQAVYMLGVKNLSDAKKAKYMSR